MIKTITAFGIFAAVAIAGAFFFNAPTVAEATTTEVLSTCDGGNGGCGCASAGDCGKSGCTAEKKAGCGCGK
jgi:hypothetical protein